MTTLAALDLLTLGQQIREAQRCYRLAAAAAERNPTASRLQLAEKARTDVDRLLDQWPRQETRG